MNRSTREAVRARYSGSAEHYDAIREENPRGALLTQHDLALFLWMLPLPNEAGRTLEVGAGTGRFTLPALHRGLRVTATDVNEGMLLRLAEKVRAAGFQDRCRLVRQDMFRLAFRDESFDLVFCIHVVPRLLAYEDQRAALAEMGRVLRSGGRLLFNYRNRKSLYGLAARGYAATPAKIREALHSAGLKVADQRGKWLLTRRLLDITPLAIGRFVAALDARLAGVRPERAWDVFVLAEKVH